MDKETIVSETEVELKDYFAARAMQAYIVAQPKWSVEDVARYSYKMALAMIKAEKDKE